MSSVRKPWGLRRTWTYGDIGKYLPPEIIQRFWTERGAHRRCRVLTIAAGCTRLFEVVQEAIR